MRRLYHLLLRNLIALIIGASCAIIASAIFPVFTIGFWQVTYAPECAIGFVGLGGSPSPTSLTASGIGASPTAKLSYRMMYAIGNPQGKMYAVMGMRYVDGLEFERMRDDLAQKSGHVYVRSGCLGWDASFESALLLEESVRYADEQSREKETNRLTEHFKSLKKK